MADRHPTPVLEDGAAAAPAAPDAGLAQIAAQFTAGLGGPRPHPGAGGGDAGPAVAKFRPWQIWALRLPPQSIQAAGTADPVDWGPPTGRAWRIEEVTVTLVTATLVQFYKEAAQPVNLRFQTAVSGVWEPKNQILLPGERLICVVTGGAANVAIEGLQMDLDILPDHVL